MLYRLCVDLSRCPQMLLRSIARATSNMPIRSSLGATHPCEAQRESSFARSISGSLNLLRRLIAISKNPHSSARVPLMLTAGRLGTLGGELIEHSRSQEVQLQGRVRSSVWDQARVVVAWVLCNLIAYPARLFKARSSFASPHFGDNQACVIAEEFIHLPREVPAGGSYNAVSRSAVSDQSVLAILRLGG